MITGKQETYTQVVTNVLEDIEKTVQEEEKKLTKKELREIIKRQDEYINKLRKEREKDRNKLLVFFLIIWVQMLLILVI